MKAYTYTHPNTITTAPMCMILDEQGQEIGHCQRTFKNRVTKWMNTAMDHKYFVCHIAKVEGEATAKCKKISRKGRVYYRADLEGYAPFEIGYVGWRDLIPDLQITNGEVMMSLHKEMDEWSVFEQGGIDYARWLAVYSEERDEFDIRLEIFDDAPIKNPAFYIAIAQTILYIGS